MGIQGQCLSARRFTRNGRTVPISGITVLAVLLAVTGQSAACALATAPSVARSSWDRVLNVSPGELVEVALWDRQDVSGEVADVDAAGITVRVRASTVPQRIPRVDIRRLQIIRVNDADSLKNGALIGAGVGIVYVLAVLAYIAEGGEGGEPSTANWITGPPIAAGIGAGIGALIDLVKSGSRKETVFVGQR